MADYTLQEYVEILKAEPKQEFQPFDYYNRGGDSLEIYFLPGDAIAERVDSLFTVLVDPEDESVTKGVVIKNISRINWGERDTVHLKRDNFEVVLLRILLEQKSMEDKPEPTDKRIAELLSSRWASIPIETDFCSL